MPIQLPDHLSQQVSCEAILYLVPTPISPQDILNPQSRLILSSVNIILCEDTRKTKIFLKKWKISTFQLVSYHQFNAAEQIKSCLKWLAEGKKLALVCDAGTPLVSDPGQKLVAALRQTNYRIHPVGINCAALAALISSGLAGCAFYFYGFLNKKFTIRKNELLKISHLSCPIIFYESPMRVLNLLTEMEILFPEAQVFVAKEIQKPFETFVWGTIREVLDTIKQVKIKGEFTIVIRFYHRIKPLMIRQKTLNLLLEYNLTTYQAKKIVQRLKQEKLIIDE